jgi:hypothetical protein
MIPGEIVADTLEEALDKYKVAWHQARERWIARMREHQEKYPGMYTVTVEERAARIPVVPFVKSIRWVGSIVT